ncbi:MAG: bis(5'-nucleosyl)-tetraphosphatase (symmetrical) YqeK, partial [Oscillospiraceae bacterium]|nr:bis(5'-nucleosyl)-tetraphosphatase (symmetrical) YqeK [Candidatus Equicaccousia limihippi]
DMAHYLAKMGKTVIVPAYRAPHKDSAAVPFEDRVKMCEIAFAGIENLTVSALEQGLGEKSYTVNTVKEIKKTTDEQICLAMGDDMARCFDRWYKADELASLCEILVFARDGKADLTALDKIGARYRVLDFKPQGLSSSKFRQNLDFSLLPYGVEQYIKANCLYGVEELYKKELKKRLGEKRYNHCLNVADEAKRLAKLYGADRRKAYTAGLLHDITKELSQKEQLQMASDFDIMMSDLEKGAHKLWHAMTGSAFIEKVLKIDDREIIDAVRYHTTAKKDMSLLATVLYLADYTSADRDYDGVDEMREAVDKSIEEAMYIATDFTVKDLALKGKPVHPDTVEAYKQSQQIRARLKQA